MDRVTRETWTKRIAQWKKSGLSAKVFAAEIGVRPRTLAWWGWNLGRKPRRRRATKKSSAMTRVTPATISPLTFVEMTAPVAIEPLEVVLPTTVRIRVRSGFDDTTLSRLLDVLERR